MEMADLMNLILNSSVSIVVIVYFMFRDYKFMQQLTTSIQQLVDKINVMLSIKEEGGKKDGS